MTQPGAQLSGMFHVGVTVLHHPAVGPHVADILPAPAPQTSGFTVAYGCICPRFGQGVDIVTQHWAQLSGMDGMGYAVLHHLAGGSCAKRDPPNPHTKKLALRIVVDRGVLAAHCPSLLSPPHAPFQGRCGGRPG